MSRIQEIREHITLYREPLQILQDLSEDVITNGIVSEDTAFMLLKGYTPRSLPNISPD